MLFEPDRHEALCDTSWDAARAREALVAIVRYVERARLDSGRWPVHPQDADGGVPATGHKSLYLGAAGVQWALWYLQRQGAVQLASDPARGIESLIDAYHGEPDTGEAAASYMLGEVGILLVWWRLTGCAEAADRLFAAVKANIPNPTNESLWAAPGTMVAAWHLWVATGEVRWRELVLENVEQLWRTWQLDESTGCYLWTQDLYGRVVRLLGAGHGFSGNAYALLQAAPLLDPDRRQQLYDRCVATLRATARSEGEGVNWAVGMDPPRTGRPAFVMQWCHGAPGVVTAVAGLPAGWSAELDAQLIGAGHAIWQAGPLTKGFGLCHGTAGNGYAFLALYRRSGDTVWLDRARRFAMHAVSQSEQMHARHGQGRSTLWTGDAGLAVYLWHCLEGRGSLPGLDTID
jgi:hypothetical protein